MLAPLLLVLLADTTATAPDTTERPSPRVVRRLEEVVVRASPLHDMLSSESVQRVTRENLRGLPVDNLADAIALKAGVVAQGEELHVRGGRAGETQWLLRGIPLNDPLRGRPMELPLLGVESAELVSGGLDPEFGGALAGVVQVRTVDPGPIWGGEVRWEGDALVPAAFAEHTTGYGRVGARLGGPLVHGLGAVAAIDALTDDTYLPALRSREGRWSWRADNRLIGLLKLAPIAAPAPITLEILGSRWVHRPYNPMWSLDGYTTPCADPACVEGWGFSSDPQPGYDRYRAADHEVMTDERRVATVLSGTRALGRGLARGAAWWTATRRITSIGATDDEWYLDPLDAPMFGVPGNAANDPFYVYHGYEPYFLRAGSQEYGLRGDYEALFKSGSRHGVGGGLSYQHVTMREIDASLGGTTGLDSLRAYDAWAPGGFAYAQGRYVYQGMVLNGGLRLDYFTAGPQAEAQSYAQPVHAFWMLAPRAGIAYPVSTRDVLSFSYVRIEQPPPRDFLYDNRLNNSAREPLGNPNLEPSTVISYQAAVKHLFESGRALQVAFFFRDLFGQIGSRPFETSPGFFHQRYENADEGHAEGVELGLIAPTGRLGQLEFQYTFMHAVGTQSREEGYPYGPATIAARIPPLGDNPLDWDRRHSLAVLGNWKLTPSDTTPAIHGPVDLLLRGLRGSWTVAWATRVGSPLPWTPAQRNVELIDPTLTNSARFKWEENTSLSVRWSPLLVHERAALLLDVRNLFDFRGETGSTLSGYPHSFINTLYDDDSAFRGEAGLPGGAYWDDTDRDPGAPTAWVRINDARLYSAPRLVRLGVTARW
jgi:outer membrane receptor protein involved in Fe transport